MEKNKVLTGKRFIHKYRGDQYYFNVFPGEVFISSSAEKDPLTAAAIDYMSRATSIIVQHLGKDIALDQLKRASHSSRDIPGILAILIEENME